MNKIKYLYIASIFTLLYSCKNGKTENTGSTSSSKNASTSVEPTAPSNKTEPNNATTTNSNGTKIVNDKTYVVDYRAMGAIKLDMLKVDVLKLYPNAKPGTIVGEMDIPCLEVMDLDGSLLYKVGIENDKTVSAIISSNKKMKTVSGIAVGSTLAAAKKLYPDIKVSMIEGEWVAFASKRHLSFTLDGSSENSKITEIWVN